MAAFYPVDRQHAITDGSAAPGAVGTPTNARNYTPFHRSGGEFSVENRSEMRGVAGRLTDEEIYVRRQGVTVADQTLEQDDTATVGTTRLFDMSDPRTANTRIYRVTYRTSVVRAMVAIVKSVSDAFNDGGVLLMNVSLGKGDSAALHEAGF